MILRQARLYRGIPPQARLFFACVLGMGFAIDGAYTVLLNLFLLRLGYGTELIGLINAAGLLSFALASFPAGLLGSRMSVTRLMKCGGAMATVGFFCLTLAEWLPVELRPAWLVAQSALTLAGFAFFFVNGAPFLMNTVKSGRKTQAFALKSAHLALAAFAGSLVGGFLPEWIASLGGLTLEDPTPYRQTLQVVAVILCLAWLLSLRIQPLADFHREQDPARKPKTDGTGAISWTSAFVTLIAVMTLIRLLQVAGTATSYIFFNVYMDTELGVSTSAIGGIAATGRLFAAAMVLIVPALSRRYGNVKTIIWGSLGTACCMLPIALVEHPLAAAISFIGISAVGFIRYTAFTVYVLDLVPRSQQSVMAGAGEMAAGFSFATMALGGGFILALFSFRDLFLVGAAMSFAGTLIFWWHCRKRKPKPALAAA